MNHSKAVSIKPVFLSRLETLEHLVTAGERHFGSEPEKMLELRLAPDMLPFGTQVAYTCDQPHNFARWCEGKEVEHIGPDVQSLSQAREIIAGVKASLNGADVADSKFEEMMTLELGDTMYLELSGTEYLEEFLIPNFYFHLVTAYSILRMSGVPVGKHDYMMHLVPRVKQREK
ncbi:DUF1993 domain-containing protein [Exilibacterium tricleocarpae]|uniref:DUF1993 domain-containing protein n=1 Tax=Exilibacterium tricleocarpae TaxID=2591008 RepID=A0A545T615_9GAMM|nr:DUF1993 domain-containing protein [Exilibacterium tricleocarpae]TQV72671.1 DUF1993 domain-containing protein [Exilibacterium tricleocarpae]